LERKLPDGIAPPNVIPATGQPPRVFFCSKYGHFRRSCPKAAGAASGVAQPKLYLFSCISDEWLLESDVCFMIGASWPNCDLRACPFN